MNGAPRGFSRHFCRAVTAVTGAALLSAAPLAGQSAPGCEPVNAASSELLRIELRQSSGIGRSPSDADWHHLACTRVQLYQAEVISRAGLLMALGTSWYQGAINALLQINQQDSATAELLGWLVMQENEVKPREPIVAALKRAIDTGARGVDALRACAVLSRQFTDPVEGSACARSALGAGLDSTWHLLEMSRWMAREVDTVGATGQFDRALTAAGSDEDWQHVGWHLGWFLEPEEQTEWDSLPNANRAEWTRDRFAARDIRDGRPGGSRLMQHFERLEYIDREFMFPIPRKDLGRFAVAATPESKRDPQFVRQHNEPGMAAAEPFRFYVRPYPGYDDRAAIWMRFGAPQKRVLWSGSEYLDAKGSFNPELFANQPTGSVANVREVWRYDLDGGALLLNFEGEQFDASQGATRLVAGVLGSYLCDVDVHRCILTSRAQLDGRPLTRETITLLRNDDLNHIEEATTKDDNSLRTEQHLRTSAALHRLWDPTTGELVGLAPYAVRIRDLARNGDSAVVIITLRQWDGSEGSWREKVEVRRVLLPRNASSDSWLTGYIEVPTSPTLSSWSITARQDTTHSGRAWKDRVPALSSVAGLEVSDLIVGAASQGVSARPGGSKQSPDRAPEPIPLSPLGSYDRKLPVTLSWQVKTSSAIDGATTTIAFHRLDRRGGDAPALEVSISGRLLPGINLVQRELGVDQLEAGGYRIELTVTLPDGRRITRTAPMVLD